MNKYEKMFAEASARSETPSWVDVAIRPLAADLSEATGLSARVSGPFGMQAECVIYLNESAREGERMFLTITPSISYGEKEATLGLYCDTGETTDKFAPGSLGDLWGLNKVKTRLPDTIAETVNLLRKY